MRWLQPGDFTHPLHAGLWQCLVAMTRSDTPVGPVTVLAACFGLEAKTPERSPQSAVACPPRVDPAEASSALVVVATPQLKGCDGLRDPQGAETAGPRKLRAEREGYFRLVQMGLVVVLGAWVEAQAGLHDPVEGGVGLPVQGGVGLPVAAAVEATVLPSARGTLDGLTPHSAAKDASLYRRCRFSASLQAAAL